MLKMFVSHRSTHTHTHMHTHTHIRTHTHTHTQRSFGKYTNEQYKNKPLCIFVSPSKKFKDMM